MVPRASDIDAFDQGMLTGAREERKRMQNEFKKVLNSLLDGAVRKGEDYSAAYIRQILRKLK